MRIKKNVASYMVKLVSFYATKHRQRLISLQACSCHSFQPGNESVGRPATENWQLSQTRQQCQYPARSSSPCHELIPKKLLMIKSCALLFYQILMCNVYIYIYVYMLSTPLQGRSMRCFFGQIASYIFHIWDLHSCQPTSIMLQSCG